ncbi:MAG TPA: hypothetical protein VFM64_01900 [Candidatus Nitrosotenuis sp.]|nr:hypothetical protein [Candidatus Nitrosotenuis sp.]
MSRHRYWKITADEMSKADYDVAKVLNWEIKGVREPEDQAIFIGVFMYRNGTPLDYAMIKGVTSYFNNVDKREIDEVVKFLKNKFGGEEKHKGERVFLEGSKEIYSGSEIGGLAKELESKFRLKAIISVEFQNITEEERKKSGLADAKLLPIPGKN